MTRQTALVLLSGGLDSSTLLGLAVNNFGKENVKAVSLDYGQRHKIELNAAAMIATHYGVPFITFSIKDSIGKGGLSDPDFKVPDISYDEIQGVSPTYVPFRNGLLLSTITSLAAGMQDLEGSVGYGAHAEDANNWAYPDCTPEFIGAMANAIFIGTYYKWRLWTPFMWHQKWQIVQLAIDIQAPLHLTWSCYKGEELHCGTCPTCLSRKKAFDDAYVLDPTRYAA